MASQITSLTIAYSTVYWGVDQRKHQNSASQAFVRGIHRHKWPVTRKVFPLDDVIMYYDNWFINDRITFVIKNVFKTLKNIQLPVGFSIYHRSSPRSFSFFPCKIWYHYKHAGLPLNHHQPSIDFYLFIYLSIYLFIHFIYFYFSFYFLFIHLFIFFFTYLFIYSFFFSFFFFFGGRGGY